MFCELRFQFSVMALTTLGLSPVKGVSHLLRHGMELNPFIPCFSEESTHTKKTASFQKGVLFLVFFKIFFPSLHSIFNIVLSHLLFLNKKQQDQIILRESLGSVTAKWRDLPPWVHC